MIDKEKRFNEARTKIENVLSSDKHTTPPNPAPRYDDVFYAGTAQLDAIAKEETNDMMDLSQYVFEYQLIPRGSPRYKQYGEQLSLEKKSLDEDLWAIVSFVDVWNDKQKRWVYESMPSHRIERHIKQTRYPLKQAIEIIKRQKWFFVDDEHIVHFG